MVNLKKEIILDRLLFLYLILFPLGQVFHDFYLADIVVAVIGAYTLITQKEVFEPKGKFLTLLMIGFFSLLFSLSFFSLPEIFLGAAYFTRLVAYVLLFFFVKARYKSEKDKDILVKSIIAVTFTVTIFGFIQYFFIPDLRALKVLGWDDHYFRLVSTFFDPTFTGIVILIGLIISTHKYIQEKKMSYFLIGLLDLIAILLTYSRSTYVALIAAFIYLLILTGKKVVLVFPILLIAAIPLLPRPSSEGVKLERTFSIFQKFENYGKGIEISKKSPVFGIGFNNICREKEVSFNESSYLSHSCSGLDSSVLLILSTTGVVGLIFFLHVLSQVKRKSLFAVCLVAVLVHSMFTNTLFYPFVMGLMAIVLAISDERIYTRPR